MTSIELCINGTGQFVTTSLDELPDLLEQDNAFVWIDVDAENEADLLDLQSRLGLYHIAVESALSTGERSKIMLFDDMLYVEFYSVRFEDDSIRADDMGMFVGERFLITARRNDLPSLESIRQRWRDEIDRLRSQRDPMKASPFHRAHPAPGSVKLLYTLLDDMVDSYFPVMDEIGDRVEKLEDDVIAGVVLHPQASIQEMRSELLQLRRLLSPEEAVMNTLLRRDVPIIEDTMVTYFADVQGHLLRIHDWLETYRDQVSSIVELHVSLQAHRLNQTMRTLTASSIILMVCGLIAGIYGMNFKHMPEIRWSYGYPAALGLMLLLSVTLILIFRRLGWWEENRIE